MKHGLIFIPFESDIVLPYTQRHVGHYGSEETFCFHAVLSTGDWYRSSLNFMHGTIKNNL